MTTASALCTDNDHIGRLEKHVHQNGVPFGVLCQVESRRAVEVANVLKIVLVLTKQKTKHMLPVSTFDTEYGRTMR